MGEVNHFSPRCTESMVWPGLLLEDRADASWSPNDMWSPSSFQNPSVVNAGLGSHTCTGPERRADPHGKQTGRDHELHLNVVAPTRSRKGMERSSVGDRTERKGKTGDEKKWGYLPCAVRSSFSTPFSSCYSSQPCWTSFSMFLTLIQDNWEKWACCFGSSGRSAHRDHNFRPLLTLYSVRRPSELFQVT